MLTRDKSFYRSFIALSLALVGAFTLGWSPLAIMFIVNSDQVFKCIPAYIHVNSYRWVKRLTRQ